MENNNDTKYVNGAPLIHSLGDDIGINNNHSSPPEIDIHNAINDLDKEKKIKMIIIVIIAIIVVFGGTVFAYFYFRDKAKTAVNINTVRQESSSTTSVNNLATIPTYLNNQDTFLPTDTTNMAVDKNKEKSISDIWEGAPADFVSSVNNLKIYEDYIEMEIIEGKAKELDDMLIKNKDIVADIASSVFDIKGIKDIAFINKLNKRIYYSNNGEKIIAYSIFETEDKRMVIIFANGFRPILQYK